MRGDTDIYIYNRFKGKWTKRDGQEREREIFDENIWDWRRKKKKKEERMGYEGIDLILNVRITMMFTWKLGNWEESKQSQKANKCVNCGVWSVDWDWRWIFCIFKKKKRGGGHVVAFKFQPTARTTRVNLSLSLSWRLLFIARIKCVWLHGYIWLSWDWEILQ